LFPNLNGTVKKKVVGSIIFSMIDIIISFKDTIVVFVQILNWFSF